MTDAEATIRYAINSAIIDNAPISNNNVKNITESVFKRIFESDLVWSIKDYLKELENGESESTNTSSNK